MKIIRTVSLLFIYLGLLTITSIIFIQGTSYENAFIGASTESSAKNSLRSIALVESDYYAENGKYFLTIEGNQTKNINNILFSGKKTLNEDGYYGFYILSEGDSGFKACTILSSFGQTRRLANYCVNQEGQLWKLPKIVNQLEVPIVSTLDNGYSDKTSYTFSNLNQVNSIESASVVGVSPSYSYGDADTDLTEEDRKAKGEGRNPFKASVVGASTRNYNPFNSIESASVKASLKSIQAPESEKIKKILRFDHEKLSANKISLTNQNQVLNIIYIISIGVVFVLVFILIENYVPYRRWLGFSHFYRSHSISKLTIFSRWVVVALVVILFFTILIKLALSIVTIGLPEFLSLYLLRIDEILGIQDFLNSHEIYFDTASQIKSAQYLFAIPAIFSLIAIPIILHFKKKLLIYTTKLAKGENVEPPKIRLQEFSEIVNAIDTLQSKLKGKKYIETFMSSIAHEIRIPLIGIKENTKILNLSMNEKDFIQSKNNILESNSRMTKIIDSLLQLSLLEQPDKNLKKDKFNIKEAIENILNDPDIIKKIKDKNISIKTINLNVFLEGNQALIEMCLSNVLNNAIDFSFKDKGISIKAIETEENISIKILDKGAGIPDNMMNKIHERFVSTARPGTNERSTGLGLSIVKIIMDLHNATFKIDNHHEKQAVIVTLTFPR